MAEVYLRLSAADRLDALGVASGGGGRPAHLLEKDVWVVWALGVMFESAYGSNLVFKGGTSLSKAYRAIQRFSEDVDLTYDIRAIAGDLVGSNNPTAVPPSSSQEKKWSKKIRERLGDWTRDSVLPLVRHALEQERLPAQVSLHPDPKKKHIVQIEYEHVVERTGYSKPVVLLEFGARSTGEPCEPMDVRCDAAAFLPALSFPECKPRVMKVERTFWEKATAVHVFCMGGDLSGERFSRHWYDLARLDSGGHLASVFATRTVPESVAEHKAWFFEEKDSAGTVIDYRRAVSGEIRLVPDKHRLAELAADYQKMRDEGLLLQDAAAFEEIMEVCRFLEERVNAAMGAGPT